MDFELEIEKLTSRATGQIGALATEEATKTALVLPMLRALGYDVFNPEEVVPEYTADHGIKRGEKVDYALKLDGKPTILIECKTAGTQLDSRKASQLYRYFTSTKARFGVLTDGIRYEFFSDLDDPNRMDGKPFFIFDLLTHSDEEVRELRKFGKETYSEEDILSTASNLKYGRLIDAWLAEQFADPSEDLVRLIGGKVFEGRMTAQVMEWMSGLVGSSLNRAVRARVRDNLESALERGSSDERAEAAELPGLPSEDPGIVTTEEEIGGHLIVQAILSEFTDPDRVTMRDAKSYCAILLDDNNRKPICRLRFDGRQWRVGTFVNKQETLNDIDRLSDIYRLRAELQATLSEYDGELAEAS